MARRDTEAAALQMFEGDTREHVMTVLHDEGLYRHIRFARPGSGICRVDIVTWPGHLSIGGDRETYVFSRVPDMLAWFHEDNRYGINPGYWAEKLVTSRTDTKRYSEETCRAYVVDTVRDMQGEHPGLWRDVKDNVLDDYLDDLLYPDTARLLLRDYTYTYNRQTAMATRPRTVTVCPFENSWEVDLTDWDFSYLWTCHAIRWGVAQYYAAKAAEPAPVPA